MVKTTLIDEAGSAWDKVQMRRRAIFWRRNIPSAQSLDSISSCITLVRILTETYPLHGFKIHLQISFPHASKLAGGGFWRKRYPLLSAICSTSRFRFLKEAGRKEIMVLRLARSWLPFLSNFLVAPAIYIIPPADHNARIKRPRYEDIRSVNKSWPIATWNLPLSQRNSMRI